MTPATSRRITRVGVWIAASTCVALAGCSREHHGRLSPEELQQRYGISDAYTGQVTTPDGTRLSGTIVPTTLSDGRSGQFVIPEADPNEPHTMYVQDAQGLHPVELQSNVNRE